ncbi:MAG: ATP-binding protein [Hydrogenophilaceae bacterium]
MMPRVSIRRRLLTALIGLATLPLVLAGVVLGWRAYQLNVDEAYAHKQEMARRVAVQAEAFMEKIQANLESGIRLSDFAVADTAARRQTLTRILAMRGIYREIAFLAGDGRTSIHLSNSSMLDPGQAVPAAFQEAARAAADSGKVVYGAVYYDPGNNEPLMLLAVPVRDLRAGALAGVVVAEVRFKPIWNLIAGLDLAAGEDVYLLDEDGRVIAHRNPSIVLRETRINLDAGQRRQPGLDSADAFVAVQSFELGQRTFQVVAQRVAHIVLQPAIGSLLITIVVILLTLLGVFALGIPLSRRISRPIIAVSETARAIRDGDLDRRARVEGDDEIGELASTFNSMTARLRATVQELEAEVQERRRAQQALERLNRAYLALSMSNQAVTRATDETALMQEACRIVKEDCGYRLVWIGMVEHDADKTVRPLAQAGFEAGYLDTVKLTWSDSERGRGPTGTAIRERRGVVCQDIVHDPRFTPWREQALKRGYASSAALPIQSDTQVYGALMVYAGEANAFSEAEIGLLSELAENIAFGIARLRALTERQAAEASLAQAKELFQTVTQFATDWSYWRSEDQQAFMYISPICEAVTGYGVAEFERDPALLDRIIHPDDRARWDGHLAEHGEDASHEPQEYRIVTKQGEVRWISHTCRPVLGEDGSRMGLRGSNQDITERKLAEAELAGYRHRLEDLVSQRTGELRRQQAFVEAVLENVADGIVACDERGNLSLFNHASREMHGIDVEELPPERWAERYQLYLADGVTPMGKEDIPLYRAFLGETVQNQAMVIRHRDGGKIDVVTSGQAMFDDLGGKIGAVVTLHDVTEQNRAKADLQRAKEAAETANRAKSVFLANMSHELRTPLNAILGFAQIMARDTAVEASHRRELETIDRAGHHLLSLINDVLEISRIEAGRTTIQNETFDLTETLAAIEDMIRVRADAKGLALKVTCHGELHPYVMGDAPHLRQVLINLLGNAVKYTDQGEVGLHVHPLDGDVRFEVTDTGPGIAADEQERIFQAFYQTEAGIRKGEGTGLGLTISREFVRLMGGEIAVASAPGQGSRFSFTLPLPATGAPEPAGQPGRVTGLEAGHPVWRILVVEDNPDSREFISRLLGDVGFQVRSAENGQEAVAMFESWRPHFIWMDMRMPVLDGYQATRQIRAMPGGRDVHIAALTASAFQEDRDGILAAGCDEMVRKPIEQDRLFAVMAKLLGVRFTYAEAVAPASLRHDIDLSALPAAARKELGIAAEMLDMEAARAVVERLSAEYPDLARDIAGLIDGYRFDRLAELCLLKEKKT